MAVHPFGRGSTDDIGVTRQNTAPGVPGRTQPLLTQDPAVSASGGHDTGEIILPRMRIRHYEVIRELGRGGMARVFLARDTRLGRRVALKFVAAPSPEATQLFVAEAKATARCNHENIVVIHEVDVHEDMPYMVLEYLDGMTLLKRLTRLGIPTAQALDYMIPVVRALVRAHESGIIHRDLKPENVFVTSSGQIKVLDFGIAKALGDRERGPVPAPRVVGRDKTAVLPEDTTGGFATASIGTPAYMSPEQYGRDKVDHRTDIWAVGVMLYQMIGNAHPVGNAPDSELAERIRNDSPVPSIAELVPQLPDGVAAVIDRCLAKDKEDRWSTASELLEALEQLRVGPQPKRLLADENPFPGLKAFQEEDADRFFGRGKEIRDAVARLRDAPVLAVVGPSGVGKSSFVRAGVVPTLKSLGERWRSNVIRPGRQPLRVLAGLLAELGDNRPARDIETELMEEPGLLGAVLREHARKSNCRSLLFVDQLEELYTLGASDAERGAFISCIGGIADDPQSRMRLVVSMRTDLLDRVTEHPYFADSLMRGMVLLATPGRDALVEAVTEPLKMAGYSFEHPGIVSNMLAGLAETSGALPLLQFVASTLWDSRDEQRKLLTQAAYNEIGGIAGALAEHADDVLRALSENAQRAVRSMFHRLVTPDRTRAIADRSELIELAGDAHEGRRLVDYLVSERLLMVQGAESGGRPTVEIVHESLISSWPTLRRWLDEDADNAAFIVQVQATAKQWHERGRPDGLLWTGDAAREAASRQEDPNLAPNEREYLAAVVRLASRDARRKSMRALIGLVVLALVAVVSVISAFLVGKAERKAANQAEVAVQEADRARKAEAAARTAEEEVRAAKVDVENQLDMLKQKEKERLAAVAQADRASLKVAMSREELQKANSKLKDALERSQRLLDEERARVKQLEKQKKRIINKLR